jgi:transcriptional regulator with XRE-family HTH domain
MTPAELRTARKALGLSQHGLAERLRMGKSGWQSVSRWEQDGNTIPGPVQVAVECLLAHPFTREPIEGGSRMQQCETCERPIREHCYVSIGPEQQIFCFTCCPLAGPPKINPARIICGGSRMTQLSEEVVERVARAMCVAVGNDPDSTDGRGGSGPLWQAYGKMARAAISAYEAKSPLTTLQQLGQEFDEGREPIGD